MEIKIKAGKNIYRRIKDGGFSFDSVSAFFAPAAGPRFLVTSGFDIPLLKSGAIGAKRIVWLIGVSSGAWRMAAWRQPQPEIAYQRLIEAYIQVTYTRRDTPQVLLAGIREVLDAFVDDDAVPFALSSKGTNFRLAIITALMKGLMVVDTDIVQRLILIACFFASACKREWLFHFAERFIFYSGVKPPPICLRENYMGNFAPLGEENFKLALLASAAIPLVLPGVRDIYGSKLGTYRDGGLTDYNIAQNYAASEDDIVLFFNHQERIIPAWMDKKLRWRLPLPEHTANVLMVYPSEEFVDGLPDGKVPDRDDFGIYIDDNSLRQKKWREAAMMSAHLGEDFLEAVASGKIRDMVMEL